MQELPRLPRRSDVIRSWKAHAGGVAAVLPIHYPRALLRAFSLLPVEVWGPPGVDPAQGAAHLQPYVCSIVRNALSFLLNGGLEVADVVVVPHACDSLQGLGSLLIDFARPRQHMLPLYIPRREDAAGVGFLADELRAMYRALVTATGREPGETEVLACIEREERADRLLAELDGHREQLGLVSPVLYRYLRAREYLPAEEFAEMAGELLARSTEPVRRRFPILLSGIVPEPHGLLEAIDGLGGMIVGDDLACCGRRLYPAGRSSDPFQRMAESILSGPPDPTRGCSIQARLAHLLGLASGRGAWGVIFQTVKFCEPELFDLPELRKGLQAEGVPSIALEIDLNDPVSQQLRTRVEAFLEMAE